MIVFGLDMLVHCIVLVCWLVAEICTNLADLLIVSFIITSRLLIVWIALAISVGALFRVLLCVWRTSFVS